MVWNIEIVPWKDIIDIISYAVCPDLNQSNSLTKLTETGHSPLRFPVLREFSNVLCISSLFDSLFFSFQLFICSLGCSGCFRLSSFWTAPAVTSESQATRHNDCKESRCLSRKAWITTFPPQQCLLPKSSTFISQNIIQEFCSEVSCKPETCHNVVVRWLSLT